MADPRFLARDRAIVASLDQQAAVADNVAAKLQAFPLPPPTASWDTWLKFERLQRQTLLQIGELNRDATAGYRRQNRFLVKCVKQTSKL
jgi:hypothetical protein